MRGSFDWAMLRLAILAAFVVPAALMGQSASGHNKQNSWLAAVDIAEPVLSLHATTEPETPTLPTAVVDDIQQRAAMASQAQQEAMLALRKELARELVRVRTQRENAARQSVKS